MSETAESSRYFVILAKGERLRTLSLRPIWFYGLITIAPFVAIAYLASTLYFVFHDDVVAGLVERAGNQQASYEVQLSSLRQDADRRARTLEAERQVLDEKIRDLATRQARYDAHQTVLNAIAPRSANGLGAAQAINRLIGAPAPQPVGPALGYAPSAPDKPRPERLEIHSDAGAWAAPLPHGPRVELAQLASSLDTLEFYQGNALKALAEQTQKANTRWTAVLMRAGLSPSKIAALEAHAAPATADAGGPLIPIRLDGDSSPFGLQWIHLQDDMVSSDRLHRLVMAMPLRKPFPGEPDVTSPFGARVDPFLEKMAIHTGVDLRQDYGARVHATAAGRVTAAAFNGGYGNMVEIDHGNALVTRYAHLSSMDVTEGQSVAADAVIGRIGTTGRSTGPHLHYEVRVDGDPVDPMRWFAAGSLLAQAE